MENQAKYLNDNFIFMKKDRTSISNRTEFSVSEYAVNLTHFLSNHAFTNH